MDKIITSAENSSLYSLLRQLKEDNEANKAQQSEEETEKLNAVLQNLIEVRKMSKNNQLLNGLDTTQVGKLLTQNTKNIMSNPSDEFISLQQVLIASLNEDKETLVNSIIRGLAGDKYEFVWNQDVKFEGSTLLSDLFDDSVIQEILDEEDNQVFSIEDYQDKLQEEIDNLEEGPLLDSAKYLKTSIATYLSFR